MSERNFDIERWCGPKRGTVGMLDVVHLGGGFKHFLFSPLPGEKIPILTNIFQRGLKPPTSCSCCDLRSNRCYCGGGTSPASQLHP